MKAAQLIADALSSWNTYEDASAQAHQHFQHLDPDEVERLARRAFTEEFRATLRRKDANGVPLYGNVATTDRVTGQTVKRYKQTAMFDVDDYRVAINDCHLRAASERRTARALQKDCLVRLGVQVTLDGRAA